MEVICLDLLFPSNFHFLLLPSPNVTEKSLKWNKKLGFFKFNYLISSMWEGNQAGVELHFSSYAILSEDLHLLFHQLAHVPAQWISKPIQLNNL